jgi:hypothetical protein
MGDEDASSTLGKKKKRSRLKVGCLTVSVLFILSLAGFVILNHLPPGPEIICDRMLDASIQQWGLESGNTNVSTFYPNAAGRSRASLTLITNFLGSTLLDYNYVPGLRPDDTSDLILFYVREPCRRRWHGDSWSPFREKRWRVVNPQFMGPYELGEALTTAEFKKRLSATLEFLQKNQRQHWTNAVREHREFLNSIRD